MVVDDLIRELERLRDIESAARQLLVGAPSYGVRRVYAGDVVRLACAVYGPASVEARNHERTSKEHEDRMIGVEAKLGVSGMGDVEGTNRG